MAVIGLNVEEAERKVIAGPIKKMGIFFLLDTEVLVRENEEKNIEPHFIHFRDTVFTINKQWEVIALEQLTSHIEQAHNNRDPSRLR